MTSTRSVLVKSFSSGFIDKFKAQWPLFLVLAIGMVGYGFQSVDGFRSIPGNIGDARFNSVVLEHYYRWLSLRAESFWDPGFFFPFRNVLAFSENHIGSGPVYALLRFIGFDRYSAFQGWFLIGHATSLLGGYVAFRLLGISSVASAFGALIFAFSLTVLAKEGHAQLIYRFATPLGFTMLWLAIMDKRPEKLGWVAIWTAWQFLCSIYLGIFLVLLLATTFLALNVCLGPRRVFQTAAELRRMTKRQLTVLAVQLISSALVLLPVLLKYSATQTEYEFERNFAEIWSMLPRVQSYFLADNSVLWSDFSLTIGESLPMRHEHQMFFGGVAVALVASAYLLRGKTKQQALLIKANAIALAGLFAMTLAVDPVATLYGYIFQLPGLGSVRAVSRISLVMLVPIAVTAAVGIDMMRQKRWIPNTGLVLALSLVSFVEIRSYQPSSTPKSEWRNRVAELTSRIPAPFPSEGILYVTVSPEERSFPFYREIDAMMVAQDMGVPTLNGYSGNVPAGYEFPLPCSNPENRLRFADSHLQPGAPSASEVVSRIVLIELAPCPTAGPHLVSSGRIDSGLAKDIQLSVDQSSVPGEYIVTIFNSSTQALVTASSTGMPTRLSWRFVPLESGTQSGWDARADLNFTVAPGESAAVNIHAIRAPESGPQILEVSLVQDGQFWFHDEGMTVAQLVVSD